MVTSLAFRLPAATPLVLLVVPWVYTILDDFGLARLDGPEIGKPAERPQRA